MTKSSLPDTLDPDRFLWRPATDENRRLTLFGCACCRRIWSLLPEKSKAAVEVRERFDRGAASESDCETAIQLARLARRDARTLVRSGVDERQPEAASAWAAGAAANACSGNWVAAAKLAARASACKSVDYDLGYRQERLAQCVLFVESGAIQDAEQK